MLFLFDCFFWKKNNLVNINGCIDRLTNMFYLLASSTQQRLHLRHHSVIRNEVYLEWLNGSLCDRLWFWHRKCPALGILANSGGVASYLQMSQIRFPIITQLVRFSTYRSQWNRCLYVLPPPRICMASRIIQRATSTNKRLLRFITLRLCSGVYLPS